MCSRTGVFKHVQEESGGVCLADSIGNQDTNSAMS
jgi:hypothetical protein